jgi:hypothetical protein
MAARSVAHGAAVMAVPPSHWRDAVLMRTYVRPLTTPGPPTTVDGGLGFPQPVPGPHPPRHPTILAPRRVGKITIVGDLVEQRHQTRRGLSGGNRVHHHAPHRGQHPVDPRRAAHRHRARPSQHHTRTGACGLSARGRRTGMGQPCHEQAELLHPGLPPAARPRAPAQEQRDRMRVGLRRGLRAIAADR